METKELKIEVPEGYEIDKENSSFELIKFKKKEYTFPITWEDYEISLAGTEYYYATSCGTSSNTTHCRQPHAALFESPNKEDVIAFKAFAKLIQLRNAWWRVDNNWKPDWKAEHIHKWCIEINGDKIIRLDRETLRHPLCFRTSEIRDKFLETFKDLIEEAKNLI